MRFLLALLAVLGPQTEGRLFVDGRLSAEYRHVFNRNALAESRVLGGDLVARTPGGLLLRFSLPEVELLEVVYPDVPITTLGTDPDGRLLAADESGDVFRVVRPGSALKLSRLGHVPARPVWVGGYRASPSASTSVLVITRAEDSRARVHDLRTGRRWSADFLSNRITAYVDRRARLWIGSDNGEWGGWVARVDLPDGELYVYPDCLSASEERDRRHRLSQFECDGVYGFTELRSGQVWMHGGTMHLGRSSGVITHLEDADTIVLMDNEHSSWTDTRRYDEPRFPVTHVMDSSSGNELTVFSYGEVFRGDKNLRRWTRLTDLDLRYDPGRPDAVGSYPSVTSVERLNDTLYVSTALDGVIAFRDGRPSSRAFQEELGAARIDRMARAKRGVVYFDGQVPWVQSAGDWSRLRLEPSDRPQFRTEELAAFGAWQTELAFVDTGGDLVALAETNITPGPRATLNWKDDVPEVLSVEPEASDYFVGGFGTPDGELWAVARRGIYRFTKSGWKHGASLPIGDDKRVYPRVKLLATARAPWLLLEQSSGSLFRLWLEGEGELIRVRPVRGPAPEGTKLRDAVRWKGSWLFATASGLRAYDAQKSRWRDVRLNVDAAGVGALATDAAGRLWLGGSGLWVVDRGRVVDMSRIPALAGVEVNALIADPHRRHGIIASLGERGLLYVATSKPRE